MMAMGRQAVRQGASINRVPRLDYPLLLAAIALASLGLVMVASASITFADRDLGQPFYYAMRQAVYIGIGVLLAWPVYRVRLALLEQSGPVLLIAALALLLAVLIPGIGREVNGSMRWINAGLFNLQVSEPAKLMILIYLAGYLVRRSGEVRETAMGFLKPMAVFTLVAGLLLLEPDYGATVVLFATALGMLFLGGVPLARFTAWMFAAAAIMTALVLLARYRVQRLTTFMDPWSDPFGSGFQLTQALIAIGRGEWLGVGLGASVQKLFYLPEGSDQGSMNVVRRWTRYRASSTSAVMIAAAANIQAVKRVRGTPPRNSMPRAVANRTTVAP